MKLSQTDLANSVLALLGDMQITSLDDMESSYARILNPQFDICLNALAGVHDWTFLTKQTKLQETTDKPLFSFKKSYILPSDFLRLCEAEPKAKDLLVHQDRIYSNIDNLKIMYIKIPDDPTHLSPNFVMAFIYNLAAMITPAFKANVEIAEYYEKISTRYLERAITQDSKNYLQIKQADDANTLARYENNFTARPQNEQQDYWGDSYI